MAIEVQVGDTIVEFPDGTDHAVIQAALLKKFGKGGLTIEKPPVPAKDDSVLQGMVQNMVPFAGEEGHGVVPQLTAIPGNFADFIKTIGAASAKQQQTPVGKFPAILANLKKIYDAGGKLATSDGTGVAATVDEAATSLMQQVGGPVGAMLTPNIHAVTAALEKFRTGKPGVAGDSPLKEAAVGAVPLVGPQINKAISTDVDEGRTASAFGQMLGLGGSVAAGGAESPAAVAGAAGPAKTAAGAIRAVNELRTAGQRAGGGALGTLQRFAEGVVSKSTLSGGKAVFGKIREAANQASGAAAKMIVDEIGKFVGSDEELGRLLVQSKESAKRVHNEAASAGYKEIDALVDQHIEKRIVDREVQSPILGPDGKPATTIQQSVERVKTDNVMPATSDLKKRAAAIAEDIGPNHLETAAGNNLAKLLGKIGDLPDNIPFSEMQGLRSDLTDMARPLSDVQLPSRAMGRIKQLQQAATDTMIGAADKSGIEGLGQKVRNAGKAYKTYAETWDTAFWDKLDDLGKSNPGAVQRMLATASPYEIRIAKAHLNSKLFDAAVARNIGDIFEQAMDANNQIKENAVTKALKGNRTKSSFGNDRLNEMLPPHKIAEIGQLVEAIKATNPKGAGIGKLTDTGLLSSVLYGGPAAPLAAGTAMYVFAKVATRPGGASIIKSFLNAVNSSNLKGVEFWGTRLRGEAKASGALDEAKEIQKEKEAQAAAQTAPVPAS